MSHSFHGYDGPQREDLSLFNLDEANVTQLQEFVDILADRIQQLEGGRTSWGMFEAANTIWLFVAISELITMHVGFAMREAGLVREINMVTTYAKNLLGMAQSAVMCFVGTYNFAFPNVSGYLLLTDTALVDHHLRKQVAFHMMAQTLTCSIVSGAMAERTSVTGAFILNAFMAGVIYCFAVRCTWGGGFLSELGTPFYDTAGSAIVHMSGGVVALVGALRVGSRRNRWNEEDKGTFVPHSLSMTTSGVVLVWCGWYGYIFASQNVITDPQSASGVSSAAVNTTIAAALSGLTAVVASMLQTRAQSIDMIKMTNSIIGGLVAMAAGCDVVAPVYAVVIGIVAGFLQQVKATIFRYLHIDDVSDACAVHGVCGAWGAIAVGLFHHKTGLVVTGRGDQLLSQVLGICFLASWAACASLVVLTLMRRARCLRVTKSVETMGLDKMLGFEAYNRTTRQMNELSKASALLESASYGANDVITTLTQLKRIINRPFTPHAAEKKRIGEVSDILEQLVFDDGPEGLPYGLLLIHDTKDGCETANLFSQIAEQILDAKLGRAATASRSKTLGLLDNLEAAMGRTFSSSRKKSVQLNHVKLDSVQLRTAEIEKAQNVLVLLTRNVFCLPWCILELVHASSISKRLLCIHVEFQDNENDLRSFRFPEDIDRVLMTWQEMVFDVGDEMALLAAMRKERGRKRTDGSVNSLFTSSHSEHPETGHLSGPSATGDS
mmetsp:Transcript_27549/g.64208  ORF Transcript_27549/g.64208 Transcript_27549/m.64208 type:complete len:722 (-) Transcript_27549:87-2252(-)